MNDQQENSETFSVAPTGVPTPIAAGLLLALVAASGLAFYFEQHPSETATCVANNITAQSQAASGKAQAELNTAIQKRVGEMQEKVAKMCIDHGHVPVFINGNVDCK